MSKSTQILITMRAYTQYFSFMLFNTTMLTVVNIKLSSITRLQYYTPKAYRMMCLRQIFDRSGNKLKKS